MCNVVQYAVPYFIEQIVIIYVNIGFDQNVEHRLKIDIYSFMKKYSLGQAQSTDNGKAVLSRQQIWFILEKIRKKIT